MKFKFSRIFHFLKNEWPKYLLYFLWLSGNIVAFVMIFLQYYNGLEYFYTRLYLKAGVAFAKAAGFVLNLNSCIILLLVCRNFISYIRKILCCCPINVVRVLDRHISYHRYVGYLIIFFSIVHTLAHILNAEYYVEGYNERITMVTSFSDVSDEQKIKNLLLKLSKETDVNPVRLPNSNTIGEALKLAAGVTGIVLCIVLAIMASSSSRFIRRSYYNLFWYTHQICAVIFFLALVTHGIQGIVKAQTNLDDHDPQKCYLYYSSWPFQNQVRVCKLPKFAGSAALSWRFVIGPIVIYLIERLVRFIRGLFRREIAYYKLHPSSVIEIAIKNNGKNKINYTAGQYIYLKVPSISWFEWHPFTITSAPDDENLTVHIRTAGDWTEKLRKSIQSKDPSDKAPTFKHISVDGPYGSSAEDIYKYETVVLVGAGIGVTPYASILKDIWHKMNKSDMNLKVRKVNFFWICQNTETFEWFGYLLKNLEQQMMTNGNIELLEYNLYLTRWNEKKLKEIIENDGESRDLFTGLHQKSNFGRPNFEVIFKSYAEQVPKLSTNKGLFSEKIGVFFCGLPQLSSQLHKICNKYSNSSVRFLYNKESF